MTTKKQDIWMPLYVADYLAATSRLKTEQHGAYILLIMDYWRNGAPPDDNTILANITKLTIQAWRKHRIAISKFFAIENGEWRHKRIDAELQKAADNALAYAKRAKIAADKRWNKDKECIDQVPLKGCLADATSYASSTSKALLEDVLGYASSPSPSSINKTHTYNACENFVLNLEKLNDMLKRSGQSPIDQTQLNQALVTFTPHYEHSELTANQRYAKLVTWLKRESLSKPKTTKNSTQPRLDVNAAWDNEPKNDKPITAEEREKFRLELENDPEVFY